MGTTKGSRLALAVAVASVVGLASCSGATPAPPTAAPAPTDTRAAPLPTNTAVAPLQSSATPLPTAAITPPPTPTATIAPTLTPLPSPTPRPAPTATALPTPTNTAVPVPTATRVPTPTVASVPTSSSVPVVNVEIVAKGLVAPWALDFAPDGRIFITERPGRVRIVRNGSLEADPWITLPVAEVSEAGLLGLALDPQFAQNRFVYVAYTYRAPDGRLQNRLVRLRDDPVTGKGVVDKVLIDGVRGGNNHDGGRVKFGPDGKLYWTMGESQDPPLAQDQALLSGKVLRLNSDGSIPPDNPFTGSYVYSYGHRNPQGLAWQPGTGRLYETEHGPSGEKGCCKDEVNFIEPGKNYGWPVIAGNETREGMVSPIVHSGDTDTWAPSGAAFASKGPWSGSLLFVGLRGQSLFRLTLDRNDPRKVVTSERLFERRFGRLRDVVEGPDGALYILTSNRDGRGVPVPEDDRLLRVAVQ